MNRIIRSPDAPRLRGAVIMYKMLRSLGATRVASIAACARYLLGSMPIVIETQTGRVTIGFFSVT